MKRRFRLNKSTDVKRVRRFGKSYAHPFIVLVRHSNDLDFSRIGINASRTVGNAVFRNRSKRQLREIVRPLISAIQPGWDIILLARRPVANATYNEIQSAVISLLKQADLLIEQNVNKN